MYKNVQKCSGVARVCEKVMLIKPSICVICMSKMFTIVYHCIRPNIIRIKRMGPSANNIIIVRNYELQEGYRPYINAPRGSKPARLVLL